MLDIDRGRLSNALSGRYLVKSSRVALIVGVVLNPINQGDAIFSGGDVNALKAMLTFCVPFCVSTYGVYSALADV
ncbi:MAG: nitrate/nitrite transporter NrtS [Pseudomonadota bacterium]